MSHENDRTTIDETAKFLFTASNNALIDFITQIFSIPIRKEATDIIRVSAEYISPSPGFSRHLPDIVLEVRGGSENEPLIHIEIQTEHDGMMDMRMVKYGYLIGASRSRTDEDDIRVISIPHQVVMYLEENKRIRDELKVKIIFPNESEVNYTVPVFKLYNYSARELGEMNLYLVLPLVLVKYRKRFDALCKRKKKSQDELDIIVQDVLDEIAQIIAISGSYEENGVMDEQTKDIILSATMELYTQLHQKYIRDQTIKGKVEHMIESVTQKVWNKAHMIGVEEGIEIGVEKGKEEGMEKGIEQGIEKGKEEGITIAVKTVAKNLVMIGADDEIIMKATGLTPAELDKIKRDN